MLLPLPRGLLLPALKLLASFFHGFCFQPSQTPLSLMTGSYGPMCLSVRGLGSHLSVWVLSFGSLHNAPHPPGTPGSLTAGSAWALAHVDPWQLALAWPLVGTQ